MADEPKFVWVKPAQPKPQLYANFTHTSWTLFDVRFLLGQLVPTEPGITNAFVVEEQGAVTLSWPAVKGLRDSLTELIDSYEKTNGEIKPLKLTPSPHPVVPPTT
jgi:hypothetical protein